MKKNRTLILLLVGLMSLIGVMVPTKVQAAGLPFSVNPQMPAEQRQTTNSYFDVVVAAGKQTKLVVKLQNQTDKAVKVKATITTAQTNDNGQVDYTVKRSTDPTLTYQLPDLIKAPTTLTLPAKSTVDYTGILTMPATNFAGLIAGALVFSPVETEKATVKEKISVKNQYRYAIAVVARTVDQVWQPKMAIGAAQIRQDDYHNTIAIPIANTSTTFLNQLRVEVSAVNIKTGKKYQRAVSKMQMAPNSNFKYRLKLPEDPNAGKYQVKTQAYFVNDDQGQYQAADGQHYRYRVDNSSTVNLTSERSRKMAATIKQAKGGTPWFVYAIWSGFAVLILTIVILVIVLIRTRRKKGGGRSDEKS